MDTGTTLVYFPKKLFNAFVATLNSFCSSEEKNCNGSNEYQKCYSYETLDQEFFDSFPNFKFKFEGMDYSFRPRDYLNEPIDVEK